MNDPDPMPDVLTVKQVAARWRAKYNNAADEKYVLDCYGRLKFCKPFIDGQLVNYSREEMLARAAKEADLLVELDVIERLPEHEKKMLLVRKEDLLAFENEQQSEAEDKGRRVRQIKLIIETAIQLGFEPLSIPYGGKSKIKQRCVECYPDDFTDDGFDHAWKKASTENKLSIEDRAKYKTR